MSSVASRVVTRDATVDPLWYKDAIIYQLHVKAFADSDGNGIGDFRGLTDKLDYLTELGVTAVWLLPFYPSPLRDDGYDIAEYKAVNSSYGSMKDVRNFVKAAHERGLRVITELVINHTSDQHPWFQRARRAKPGSNFRNFYVWSDTDQKYDGTRIIFTDTEESNWAWDPVAKAYYWHRFFSHQPDLNFDNPNVFKEILRVMKFWLDMGVDGLRLDAIPYLVEREGTNNENLPETHDVIRRLRAWIDENYPDRMFLGEANQWPEDVRPYFGDGDECHMAFHFPVMPRIYMAVAQEDRHPIADIMRQTPEIPDTCQWAIFLRNHDELTLEMVSDRERDYLYNTYAADKRARINVGIRRRLAPLLNNDRRKIELLNSLLMSLPGTPIVYYGDEIGMGDNIFLGDRDGVRTPMQWSPDRNGGFSRADPANLYLPAIMDPVYGYGAVNVEAQARSPHSLLNWMRRLINTRKRHKAFGRGQLEFLYPGNRKILAYLRRIDGEDILCVANLSRASQPVELDLSEFAGRVPVELLGRSAFPPIGELPYFVTLPAYGFYWFLLTEEAEAPLWHEPFVHPLPDLMTLVMPKGWDSLFTGETGDAIVGEILPAFLPNQRWFAGKEQGLAQVEIADQATVQGEGRGDAAFLVTVVGAHLDDGEIQRYLLPLALTWEADNEDPIVGLLPYALARARRVNRVGVLHDALADAPFTAGVVQAMRDTREVPTAHGGRIVFRPTHLLAEEAPISQDDIGRLGREQSNTSMLLGDRMVLKVYRRLSEGVHPELEVGRFLTDVAGYANTPALLGSVEMISADGAPTALAVLQAFVRNQGDGWAYSQDYLRRYLEDAELHTHTGSAVDQAEEADHSLYLGLAETMGRRVAELHRALAIETDDPAFQAEPVAPDDRRWWLDQVKAEAAKAKRSLEGALHTLDAETRTVADDLLAHWDRVDGVIETALPEGVDLMKTRFHGDLHLGQLVVAKDDVYILDFEGEPARAVNQRRLKHMPLKDVAGMVRSFNYAAWAALFDRQQVQADVLADLGPTVEAWEAQVVETFLSGYHDAIGDCPSVPADPDQFRSLLNLFTLEKAFYEIGYETANRPAWARIPVRGVHRLVLGGPATARD
ncbi:maltose alpha-D-glucosyltransferase [Roseospira navarrensis]|uniref:Maltokinase n=1 Tax=Roseospira navarrensis TaxID=140058 RepID=A0A7X1ZH47_9PROT|nr:maltose alpha-D-glucosyltransferase [Roseospira navarrensis]MQX37924.1 maltose alpha-D-glucosyltransferase [Roseospira navarrensis]